MKGNTVLWSEFKPDFYPIRFDTIILIKVTILTSMKCLIFNENMILKRFVVNFDKRFKKWFNFYMILD